MIELGSLVRSHSCSGTDTLSISPGKSPNDDLGIGKVTELSNSKATVEYFCSIGQRLQITLPLSLLDRVRLSFQTRCYIKPENQDTWIIGRIFDWDEQKGLYRIDLPDKKIALVKEQEIYVRCHLPIDDPIETLAMKGQETPYFHDRRLAFVISLIQQRAVSRGMTGLISAKIDLYPHQVEVVRRVLEDPIQRYLLADEVGLGKTIEAAIILYQYLLDEPQGLAVVILVPQYLREQWFQELKNKFYLSEFLNRVQILALEDVDQISPNANLGFLILDEAHHIAAMATSPDSIQRRRFETYRDLAHQSDRLLLLSATPVLNHEQDFLTMLHLLDPITYQLNDLEGFRTRVKNRQQIGRILLSFKEGANPFVLKTNLNQLRNLFAEDNYLLNLAEDLQNCLVAKETIPTERDKIVRAIRTHISDTYRLHRRMLRNRRASVEDVIFDRSITPTVEYELDERSQEIHELIDEWRTIAPHEQQEYQRIFLLFFRASGTWLRILEQLVAARLKSIFPSNLMQEFGSDDIRILTQTTKFPGEEEILAGLLKVIQQPSEDGDRIELLKIVLLYHFSERFHLQSYRSNLSKLTEQVQKQIRKPISGDSLPKVVIFTSFVQTAAEIFRCLSDIFGHGTVASHQLGQSRSDVEKNLNQFKNDPNCFILVCDSSGEEGRNFQFVDWMIHFDLPWSPNRLEQRIGRIDRIGRPINVKFTVFAGADLQDSPHNAWYELLKDGFGIFRQSIASLQFYVDKKLPELEAALFQLGAIGLLEMIPAIQQEIAEEQVKISEQNALDEIDAQNEIATQYFEALDEYDAQHQEIKRATENWICQTLKFKPIQDPNLVKVRYQPTMQTLIPINDLKTHFAAYAEQSGTYNRRISTQNPGVNLYRIGEGFVEALASYINWDDRGKAFAMWRCDESWDTGEGMEWFGFRFNYIAEANLEIAQKVLTDFGIDHHKYKALKRRIDALFSPIIETVFIDIRYEPMSIVEDELLLNILQRSYRVKGSDSQRDYNLAKDRLPIINEFIDASKWEDLCHQVRRTSEILLRDRTAFISVCEQRAKIAEQKLGNRVDQLRLRLNRLAERQGDSPSLLAKEVSMETALSQAILPGIRYPQIKLDSVGFIIISGRHPAQFRVEGDE